MATLYRHNGTEENVEPQNGAQFTLKELNRFVDGYIEIVFLNDGRLMVVNEEGKLKGLPLNVKATEIMGSKYDCIVGDALVCEDYEIE